ncbi:uncharacterized protein LOC120699203 isoform X3 [Panicum virgatum]|uniref:uncharacterized protein LOC120699203 isoform X3 n=1 Tax=Panicum virgatum TaxID=38727 RepID=UPI0019D57E31|nr:uncharacterized protein LOC120699203 isoform X3 [Panicum virgatum]
MAPGLRRKADPVPSYSDSPEEFSVEVHHGGGFIGFGHLRLYVDGKVSWFDHCEADSWSKFWLDDMLEKLGYPETPNLKYYWLLPGKDLSDGLRIIIGDADTNVMCSVVDRIKNLVVYFDGLPRLDKTNLKSTKKNSTTGTLWATWKTRNNMVFEDKYTKNPMELIYKTRTLLLSWKVLLRQKDWASLDELLQELLSACA